MGGENRGRVGGGTWKRGERGNFVQAVKQTNKQNFKNAARSSKSFDFMLQNRGHSSEMLKDMFLHLLLCGPGAGGANEPSAKMFLFYKE